MWIFTTSGFLSIVADREQPGHALVRARVESDLTAFAEQTGAPPPLRTPDRDYRFRTSVPLGAVGRWLAAQAEAIDYGNFKSAVAARQGDDRAHRYADVWSTMYALQSAEEARVADGVSGQGTARA